MYKPMYNPHKSAAKWCLSALYGVASREPVWTGNLKAGHVIDPNLDKPTWTYKSNLQNEWFHIG